MNNLSPMYRTPEGNVVQFYEMAVPHEKLSEQTGRAVVWKAMMAIIRGPGMKNQEQHQQIYLHDEAGKQVKRALYRTTADKRRVYWDEVLKDPLRAYKEGREGTADGTPLENYPKIDVAQAAQLRANGVHNLEQLGAVPDAQLHTLGPHARDLRDGAARFLSSMTSNDAIRQQNAEMQRQLAEMQKQLAELTAAKAAEPGRSSKAAKAA